MSVQGKGSTFFAVLPRSPAVTTPLRAPAARILVVDDQKLDRLLLTRILESSGYQVEVCTTSAEAYDKCRWQTFDAITLDLVLPDAAGWETLERIRALENHRHTPVIVISACEPADLNVPLEVQGFLTKPVNAADLLGVLKRTGAMASKPEGVNA
jgi:CheY-like chemotaxis protein